MTLPHTNTATDLPPLGHFIGGEFHFPSRSEALPITSPVTGKTIAEVPIADRDDVNDAVAAARSALPSWSQKTSSDRSEALHKIADLIASNAARFEELESLNTGKPSVVVADDVSSAIDTFRFMAGAVRAATSLAAADYTSGHTSVILREPVGVVGVITPWNYPLLMAAWKIAPILAAGNTVVLKPSELTPLTTLLLASLTSEALEPGVLNIVNGTGEETGAAISHHPDIDLVAITGSVRAGSAVASAAAESRKRVHLELGGKAPVIVFEDADLEAVAKALRSAAFWNSGQECGAACRILVHESVAQALERHLTREIREIKVGDPASADDIEVGPLISASHKERVLGYITRATGRDGMRAITGDKPLPLDGYFVAPTLLIDARPGTEATQEEIFGPVITLETFSTETEAVKRANETPYGLASSVWTSDAKRSIRIPRQLDFGTVWVNAHLVLANEVPWGGFKGSGYGRDLSLYALDDFSRTKHVMINHSS